MVPVMAAAKPEGAAELEPPAPEEEEEEEAAAAAILGSGGGATQAGTAAGSPAYGLPGRGAQAEGRGDGMLEGVGCEWSVRMRAWLRLLAGACCLLLQTSIPPPTAGMPLATHCM